MEDDGHNQQDQGEPSSPIASASVSLAMFNRLLRASGSAPVTSLQMLDLLSAADDDQDDEDYEFDDEDEDDEGYMTLVSPWTHRRNSEPQEPLYPTITEPQDRGLEILYGGEYGRIANKARSRAEVPNKSIARTIGRRSEGGGRRLYVPREDLSNALVPNTHGTAVASYQANIYTAQYSKDSSFYYTCSQDFRLYVFDSATPPASSLDRIRDPHINTNMTVKQRIQGHPGRWTITDANLSPDNQRMIYSSITPTVYMTSTVEENPVQIPIPFADDARTEDPEYWGSAIYSCTFSADGNEVVAGGNGMIFVYDLLANRRSVKIEAHQDDVNSCCWADTASGNVLVSASDDTFLKVWDRRSLGASPKPSGVLMGHTEGITYVSAKGDGRYILSNGKDQAMRLWDLRKMRSSIDHEKCENRNYGIRGYDYRNGRYKKPKYERHPMDCSVMTYRGHSVFRTLIRCHFSPAETTGGQYLYSGSADGMVHIYSLDGTVVQVLDRSKTLPLGYDPSGVEPDMSTKRRGREVCVRDVSWHSQEPVLMSAGWDTGRGSVLARHEWKGLQKMRWSLEDWTHKQEAEASELHRPIRLRRAQQMPGSFYADEDD